MAKRLIKVAKDLNVGMSTLVAYLNEYGFEVENSPRAIVSQAAYEMLIHNKEQLANFQSKSTLKNKNTEEPQLKGLKIKGKIDLNRIKKLKEKAVNTQSGQQGLRVRRRNSSGKKEVQPSENKKKIIDLNSNINHKIYKALQQEKKLTEFYIGNIPFQWNYTLAHYTAELTEAVGFTLFDKVICGILQLDEVASLEEIGTILGMNVVDNRDKKQYLDPAEREILVEALQLLEDYKMITTGDTYYSRCRLTETGKEYAAQGYKFNITENVPFQLYFDNFSNQHRTAKQRFQNIAGTRSGFEQDLDLLDDRLMRQVAEIQAPNIYNPHPKQLRSFRDAALDERKTQSYALELYACLIVDVETQDYSLKVYVPEFDKFDVDFSNALNEMTAFKEDLMLQFIQKSHAYNAASIEVIRNQKYLIKQQKAIDKSLKFEGIEAAQAIVKTTYSNSDFIDKFYLINNLENFITNDYQEIWLIFEALDEVILDKLNQLIRNFNLSYETALFIVIPNGFEIKSDVPNIWILNSDEIEATQLFFRKHETLTTFVLQDYPIKLQIDKTTTTKINTVAFAKEGVRGNTLVTYRNYRYQAMRDCNSAKVEGLIKNFEHTDNQEVTQQSIEKFGELGNLFNFMTKAERKHPAVKMFKRQHAKQYTNLRNKLRNDTLDELRGFKQALLEEELEDLTAFEIFYKPLQTIEENLYSNDPETNNLFKTVNELIKQKEQVIKDELVKKTYIIDTNVFVQEPNILDWIIGKNYAVVSGKVVDELDNLKKKTELRSDVNRAIRSIKIAQNKKQIKINFGDKSLLPDSFDGRSADNLILSVAIMYQNQKNINPVLLTSDNAFQVKAKMLNIRTIDLEDFLKENPKTETEKPQKQIISKPKTQQDNNRKKIQHNNKRRKKIRKPKKR